MPDEQTISVVMPTFNAAGYVREAVDSVFAQCGAGLELVVQDGGSQDETLSILQQLDDPRISVDSRPDGGLGEALNRGVARSTGQWLVWLNADDLLMPGAVESVAGHLAGSADIICGDFAQINADGERRKLYISSPLERRRLFRRGVYVFMGATLVRREVFDRIGGYAEDLHYCADWDFCVRAAGAGRSIHVPSCLAGYRFHEDSLSVKNPWKFFPEGIRTTWRNAESGGERIAAFLCLSRIVAYVVTRRIWVSDLWRRWGPSSKRL